jgi:stage III sporulation protein AD
MNMVLLAGACVLTAVLAVFLRKNNGEISLMLGLCCSVIVFSALLTQAASVINTLNGIVSASGISIGYVGIMLKVIGICLLTEFAANTCRDAGSQSLASNVTLAGKIMVTVTALPLYKDIFNVVLGIVGR